MATAYYCQNQNMNCFKANLKKAVMDNWKLNRLRKTGNAVVQNAFHPRFHRCLGITGFSFGIVGVYWASCSGGGMSFKISPKFCPEGSLQDNMKAMIISLMMNDKLSEDEISILTNSVEYVCAPNGGHGVCKSCCRESWCVLEIKNFMNCSVKYEDFKDDRCKSFRMLLKNCLQAKKDGMTLRDVGERYKGPPYFKNKVQFKPPISPERNCETIDYPMCEEVGESHDCEEAHESEDLHQMKDASTSTDC